MYQPILFTVLVPVAAVLVPLGARAGEPVAALPRGVATSDLQSGYLTSYRHTVFALNLQTGKSTWESAIEGVPVAFEDRRVLVLVADPNKTNSAAVISIDTATGRIIWRSDPITLPEWAAVAPKDDHYFGHLVRVKDGKLWLKWLALARKPGAKVPANKGSGAAAIDLSTHKVEMLGADRMPAPELPAGVTKKLEKLAARPVETPAGPEQRVAVVGNLVVAADTEKGAVVLRRWNLKTEAALDPVTLVAGGPFVVTPFPDAGVVLVRPADGKANAPVWRLFSLETGKQILKLTVEKDTVQPTVLGPNLYYAFLGPYDFGQKTNVPTPTVRQLRAIDLKTGKKVWTVPLETLPWDPISGVTTTEDP
jgi:outer membrane protein assembly factor BamB